MADCLRKAIICFFDKGLEQSAVCSSIVTEPEVGVSNVLRQRRNVVLPEPDGPITTIAWPFWTSASMPFNTSRSPNFLCKFLIEIISDSLLQSVNCLYYRET